jgi:hypothetical protein
MSGYVAWGPVDWRAIAKPRPVPAVALLVVKTSRFIQLVALAWCLSRGAAYVLNRGHLRAMKNGYFFFDVVQTGASWCRMNHYEAEEYPPYPSLCQNYDFCPS